MSTDIRKRILLLASKFGFEQRLIAEYDRWSDIPLGKYPIDDEIRGYKLSENERKGDILFTLIPAYNSLCYRFGVLGHAFQTRGYRPVILYDDLDLPVRPEFTVDDNEQIQAMKHRYRARKFGEEFGFKTVSIGGLLGESKYNNINVTNSKDVSYRGVQLANCARSSTRKHLKQYSLDLSNPDIQARYKQFLRGGAMLVDATKVLLEQYDIICTIVNEPNYIQGAVPLSVSADAGVNSYTNKWGYRAGQMMFGRALNRHYMAQFASRDITEAVLDRELTDDKHDEVENVMAQWRNNEITRLEYTAGTGQSVNTDADTIIGLFTNLLWDGALEPDQALYDDIYEWLADSINSISDQTDTHLIIKPHPAEHLRGTNESVGDWIQATYDELPENVTLLRSDTDIDTYELFGDLDLGLIYASTVGLEMVYDGVPVVTSGYPPYHGFKITYDPDTKAKYREFIERAGDHDCSAERQSRAQRYFHFLFFCKHFEFPYHTGADVSDEEAETSQIRHDEITLGNEPWDSIVEQILAGEEVLQPDCQGFKQ